MKSGLRTRRRSVAVPVLSGVIASLLAAVVIISFAYYRQMRLNQFTKNILFSDNYFLRNYTYGEVGGAEEKTGGFTHSEAAHIVSLLGLSGARTDRLPENAAAADVKALYYNCAAQRIADMAGSSPIAFMYPSDMVPDVQEFTAEALCSRVLYCLSASELDLLSIYADSPVGVEEAEPGEGEGAVMDGEYSPDYATGDTVFNFSALAAEGLKTLAPKDLYTADDVCAVYYYCVGEILDDIGAAFGVDVKPAAEVDAVIAENAAGAVRILDVEHIPQLPEYPNGCEAVSAVMLLRDRGFDITKDEFVGAYLAKEPVKVSWGVRFGPDPEKAYAGDPASERGGWGCFAPVIESSLNAYLDGSGYEARNLSGISLDRLCEDYIGRGIPAAVWVTTDFSPVDEVYQWLSADREEVYLYPKNQHCAVLIGYDSGNYYFCDPLREEEITAVEKSKAAECWASMGSQAVVIVEG